MYGPILDAIKPVLEHNHNRMKNFNFELELYKNLRKLTGFLRGRSTEPCLRLRKLDRQSRKHDGLETRTRSLENAKFWIMGAAATVGGLAGFLVDLFKS